MRRGTRLDIPNRFSRESRESFVDDWQTEPFERDPRTELIDDHARSAFATNDSPDVPFTHSINPYRGCEHGCSFCYARPTHEYLGYNAGIDFETKILVKRNVAALARAEMMKSSWQPKVVSLSGVTDPYQPAERELKLTRAVLETMLEFRNPIALITKNAMVLRDLDFLSEMARYNGVLVFFSITTLDAELARSMEPRTSTPERRLRAMRALSEAGVPTGVAMAPLIPGLTDSEIPSVLSAAAEAGAREAFTILLRLPLAVRPVFIDWLEREQPGRAAKVLNAISGMRGGKLNLTEFGERMRGTGPRYQALIDLFNMTARRCGINVEDARLSTEQFRRPIVGGQTRLEL